MTDKEIELIKYVVGVIAVVILGIHSPLYIVGFGVGFVVGSLLMTTLLKEN